jgi:hypothetical protein
MSPSSPLPSNTTPPADGPRDGLPPGTRLDGDFEIERVLAASGFSVVYRAVDRALGRPVAIKEYLPASLALRDADGQVVLRSATQAEVFERGRAAFVEESRQLACCEHPSLVHVLRVWESRGTAYRAMPCYPGKTLLELREAMRDPPDEAALRALLDGLLGALGTLHEAGLVHGAVAPDNILLLPDDRPVLLDFGAVRRALVGSSAQGLMALLEPSFAPMERIGASPEAPPQGPWTDLYSVAALLRYCIGGRLPAPATLAATPPLEPMAEVLRRLREHSPKARYSAELLHAIDATLAPRPNDRPQSVAQFRALLDGRLDPSALRADARVRRSAAAAAAVADSVPRAAPAAAPTPPPAAASPFGAGEATRPRVQVPPPARPQFDREEPAFIEEPSDESVVAALERAMASITPAAATGAAAAPGDGPSRTARSYEAPRRAAAREGEPRQRRVVWSSVVALLMALGAIGWELSHQWTADQVKEAIASATGQVERSASETFARVQASVSAALDRVQGQATPAADAPLAALPAAPTAAGTSARPSAPGSSATDAATASLRAADAALAGATVVPPLPGTAADARAAPGRAPPAEAATTARADATAPTSTAPPAAAAPAATETVEAPHSAPMAAAPAPVQQAAVPETPPATAAPARTARTAPPSRASVARAASRTAPSARDSSARRSVAAASSRAPAEVAAAAPAPVAAPAPPVVEAAPPPKREAVVAKGPASPREACGERTQFALYYCMQTQCEQSQWSQHAQCKRLRDRDEVD